MSKFLDVHEINNYDRIISDLIEDPQFENIDEIIGIAEDYDKIRNRESIEFKQAIFTIIRGLLKDPRVKPSFIGSFVFAKDIEKNPPKTEEEIFNYLDKYWDALEGKFRGYLLFFEIDRKSK